MNIFEGSRRVAAIGGVLIILAALFAISMQTPYVVMRYEAFKLGDEVLRVDDECRTGLDGIEYGRFADPNGREYSYTICFTASEASNGSILVPYKLSGDYVLMDKPYSDEVRAYTKNVAARFSPEPHDVAYAASQYRSKLVRQWFSGIGLLLVGLFLYWLSVKSVGWIVRGFMGIPRGQDKK